MQNQFICISNFQLEENFWDLDQLVLLYLTLIVVRQFISIIFQSARYFVSVWSGMQDCTKEAAVRDEISQFDGESWRQCKHCNKVIQASLPSSPGSLFYIWQNLVTTSIFTLQFCDNLLKENRMKSSQVPRVPLHSSIVKFVALFNLIQEGSQPTRTPLN